MWSRVCSNDHAPLTVMPYIIFFFKIKNCLKDDLFINCDVRIGKMLHNICISAVAMSLRWATRGPCASCFALCYLGYFVLVFLSPFSITITSLGEERANLSALYTFVRFVLVWFCLFPLPLGVWEGLRLVIVALPGLFSYPFGVSWSHWGVIITPDLGCLG